MAYAEIPIRKNFTFALKHPEAEVPYTVPSTVFTDLSDQAAAAITYISNTLNTYDTFIGDFDISLTVTTTSRNYTVTTGPAVSQAYTFVWTEPDYTIDSIPWYTRIANMISALLGGITAALGVGATANSYYTNLYSADGVLTVNVRGIQYQT